MRLLIAIILNMKVKEIRTKLYELNNMLNKQTIKIYIYIYINHLYIDHLYIYIIKDHKTQGE